MFTISLIAITRSSDKPSNALSKARGDSKKKILVHNADKILWINKPKMKIINNIP